jgi:NTP pyrophosphatase (non-canonical NTP hydrolase)
MAIDFEHVKFDDVEFSSLVHEELARARKKFPLQNTTTLLLALMEEVGELAQAFLQKQGSDRIMAEAVQVAAMAARVAVENRS